ncbi:hypothetical protein KM043_000230 [Ampulex compressa]|nr:hypothetical protein KM043_000230 [Ampulex compressa]
MLQVARRSALAKSTLLIETATLAVGLFLSFACSFLAVSPPTPRRPPPATRRQEDEELMRETTKFVSEVIETATSEASKRKTQTQEGELGEGSRLKGIDTIAGWNHRARGFCNRILNALCPCFANNELFAWTPYRYRFARP